MPGGVRRLVAAGLSGVVLLVAGCPDAIPNHGAATISGGTGGSGGSTSATTSSNTGATTSTSAGSSTSTGGPASLGSPCTAGADCASNFCANGVCCSTACSGPCNTCNLGPYWAGTCTSLHIGDQGGCMSGWACDGTLPSQMCKYGEANGAACATDASCVSGSCVNGFCVVPHQPAGFPCKDNSQCGNPGCQANHVCG